MKRGTLRQIRVNKNESIDEVIKSLLKSSPAGTDYYGALVLVKVRGPAFPEVKEGEPYTVCHSHNDHGFESENTKWENLTFVESLQ